MADADALRGKTIAVPESRQLDVLAGLLERRGAAVLRCPLVAIEDAPDEAPIIAWLERLIASPPGVMVFYTGEGVQRLHDSAAAAGLDLQFVAVLHGVKKLARGPKPKRALDRLGLGVDLTPPEPTTAGLIAALEPLELAGMRVGVQLYSPDQEPTLLDFLRARGAVVDAVAPYVYRPAANDERVADLIATLARGAIDAIAFTSKAQVHRLREVAHERGLEDALAAGLRQTKIAAVGPVAAAELEAAGFEVAAMPEDSFSMKPLVTALCELLGTEPQA